MPSREVAAKELAEIFKLLAHADRIKLVEELRDREMAVGELAERLGIPTTRVSQHLSILRAHRIVEERPEGRLRYYHLVQPDFAAWIVDGLEFVEGKIDGVKRTTIKTARRLWTAS